MSLRIEIRAYNDDIVNANPPRNGLVNSFCNCVAAIVAPNDAIASQSSGKRFV